MRQPILASVLLLTGTHAASQADGNEPFRIFFDWGKPELTRDAQTILDQVAAAYQQSHPDRVYLAAHTDRSGSSAVNLAASKKRAKSAMDYLVAHGVPATSVIMSAYGESQPIVPTEDGVREVQNRRVEIRFGR